jgi:DNA polymerase
MIKFPHANCDECTLQSEKSCKSYFPRLYQYKAMFVGQAPGSNETYTNVPFSGPAGKTHYSILRSVGLAKDQFAHTNSVQCFPPGDRRPTFHEMMCCFPRLKEEILTVQPKLLIALGDAAMWTLTGLSGNITSYRGRVETLKSEFEWDCPVLISFHPSFVMRSRQWIPIQAVTYNKVNEFFFFHGIDYDIKKLVNTMEYRKDIEFTK